MDTCCQYSAHLRNLAGQGVLDNLECYVGWLHSKAGHDMACQLKFSALYAEDFGRAIGENAEQLHVSLDHARPLATPNIAMPRLSSMLVHCTLVS